MKLFIGKLSSSVTEAGLRELFAKYEPLTSLKIMTDKMTGEPRGFGFIEISDDSSAREAISTLNGASLEGQNIVVNEARPPTESGSRGGGSGYRDSSRPRNGGYRSSGNSRY